MSATQTIQLGAELFSRARHGINTTALRNDVRHPFRFLFCGDPALIAEMRSVLLRSEHGHDAADDAPPMLETLAPQRHETIAGDDIRLIIFLGRSSDGDARLEDLRHFKVPILALTVDETLPPSGAPSAPAAGQVERMRIESLELAALRPRVFPFMIECCKKISVAVGRRFPVLRDAACSALTRDTARTAMKVSAPRAPSLIRSPCLVSSSVRSRRPAILSRSVRYR